MPNDDEVSIEGERDYIDLVMVEMEEMWETEAKEAPNEKLRQKWRKLGMLITKAVDEKKWRIKKDTERRNEIFSNSKDKNKLAKRTYDRMVGIEYRKVGGKIQKVGSKTHRNR